MANQTLPPIDLRHMTSNGALSPGPVRNDARRTSQHLRAADPRLGSRSPNSIPSSPTSVHSSSSAIFERDIEPLVPPSPPHSYTLSPTSPAYHPPNPHRIPRAKGTEALEASVPSVLDSAAAILGSLAADPDAVAVVAPAPASTFDFLGSPTSLGLGLGGRTSGFASPIGSFRSRSPSPSPRAEALLAAATAQIASTNTTAIDIPGVSASPRPALRTVDTGATLTAGTSRGASLSPSASPRPLPPPALSASPSLAPSPGQGGVAKRLSFMSYADLRAATPAATTSLTQLTSGAGNEPPPHIPGVSGLSTGGGGSAWGGSERGAGSAAPSVRGMSIGSGLGLSVPPPVPVQHAHGTGALALLDLGGEWEREGLGRGLEERLEGEAPLVGGATSMEALGV
ncbi:hypothetical protein HYPSUDRAFT_71681 [Hypholoma sublateritium FD-334 SS-4]|uniref:Uncharacterized protein n=1 Tax=Hypholoma sublateritium (strain FD-334 SS-4) TaxID=945553 RepID=A0A0D2KN02_HYPSF|nr:hypothetical protein HYPSUDRAFT_71681 [Hypholoma sublateritium FD-334 SS-4]